MEIKLKMYHNHPPFVEEPGDYTPKCSVNSSVTEDPTRFTLTFPAGNQWTTPQDIAEDYALRWAGDIVGGIPRIGADDGYFDYFPDYVQGLLQLCWQIKYRAAYDIAVFAARATRYNPEDPYSEADDHMPLWDNVTEDIVWG